MKNQNTKLQTPGFSLTCHKKPGKCRILRGAKRAGFWLRMGLMVVVLCTENPSNPFPPIYGSKNNLKLLDDGTLFDVQMT